MLHQLRCKPKYPEREEFGLLEGFEWLLLFLFLFLFRPLIDGDHALGMPDSPDRAPLDF
jgi:hypothetical protein